MFEIFFPYCENKLVTHLKGKLFISQQQIADSFDKLNQDLRNEINWLSDVEQLLKDDQPVSEEAYKATCQKEAMKVCIKTLNYTMQNFSTHR